MDRLGWNQLGLFLILGLTVVALGACATMKPGPKATLKITPDKTVLTPQLLKEPIVFSGSGFEPKEIIVIEMNDYISCCCPNSLVAGIRLFHW